MTRKTLKMPYGISMTVRVKEVQEDGQTKYAVGYMQDGEFNYYVAGIYDTAEEAANNLHYFQLKHLQAMMDMIWDQGKDLGEFSKEDRYEDIIA
jgi:hypothetical protein